MSWSDWLLVAFLVLSICLNVAHIGKPREPITPAQGVASVVLGVLLIVLVML